MDLAIDADLYSDLYETDIAGQAAEENVSQPLKQDSKTETPASESAESTALAPVTPATQQIPTYEDPTTASYRSFSLQQGNYEDNYEQSFSTQEHRSIRPSEMKEDGKMFIGGLNWETTDEGLREYFEQFGKVDACTIMRDPSGRSRCFAFLTFEDPASVNAVMVKEHVLDGKVIDPKRAIPRQEHQRATKLFIGGLAGTVTSESMRSFFSQFGKVVDSTVMLDRETGRSKGFGFLSIEEANVNQWLGFGHLEIDGKLIDVKLAQPRYQRETLQEDEQSGSNYNQRGSGGNRAFNSYPTASGNNGTNFGGGGGSVANGAYDPQALANLYTRMLQMGGSVNPMMNGGMNPMMNMNGGHMGGNIGMGSGMGMGGGRGGVQGGGIPRGPRGSLGGMGGAAGVGPSRQQRGQHNYHPYGR